MNSSLLALFLDKYPDVWLRFMEHMNMTTMAVLLSIAIGVPLGILITRNKTASNIVIGIANLMQSMYCVVSIFCTICRYWRKACYYHGNNLCFIANYKKYLYRY